MTDDHAEVGSFEHTLSLEQPADVAMSCPEHDLELHRWGTPAEWCYTYGCPADECDLTVDIGVTAMQPGGKLVLVAPFGGSVHHLHDHNPNDPDTLCSYHASHMVLVPRMWAEKLGYSECTRCYGKRPDDDG